MYKQLSWFKAKVGELTLKEIWLQIKFGRKVETLEESDFDWN